jgi:protein-S-isoprenylcysteine O-methyltransferase Ste14
MISGVAGTLLAEATLLGSPWLVAWFGLFVAINAVYVPLVEEPGLARRFGHEYRVYRDHVPRWIPRLGPFDRAGHPER